MSAIPPIRACTNRGDGGGEPPTVPTAAERMKLSRERKRDGIRVVKVRWPLIARCWPLVSAGHLDSEDAERDPLPAEAIERALQRAVDKHQQQLAAGFLSRRLFPADPTLRRNTTG